MSIYSKKQQWKWLLFGAAAVIFAASLWYTGRIVSRIAVDERLKVQRWAEALQKKAQLVTYTNEFFKKITTEERKKVELWAEATKQLNSADLTDYSFVLKVVTDNTTVPVILTDESGKVIASRNVDSTIANHTDLLMLEIEAMKKLYDPIEISVIRGHKNFLYYKDSRLFSELKVVFDGLIQSFNNEVAVNLASIPVVYVDSSKTKIIATGNIDSSRINTPEKLKKVLAQMGLDNHPIEIHLADAGTSYIYYENSLILSEIKYYPYIQFIVVGLFLIIAYSLFSTARKSEQNQVWVGMAKETAHQLGTPLSSLMAWSELLKMKGVDLETITEIDKDLKRLSVITERFSKIGSSPKLERENVIHVLNEVVDYVKTRTSKNVVFNLNHASGHDVFGQLNVPLFSWVIENLCRNAVDAMDGKGTITIEVSDQVQFVYIDVTDTGKGIAKSRYKTIFEPGFTTKERGWGLGLSLSKRIIENYHEGKIFVKRSELEKGTTFRIVLNK